MITILRLCCCLSRRHFDRISTHIDGSFGTEDEFRLMCSTAASYDGTVIDDIVPGHTGKGADFRLAELGVDDYPGIYHMVAIPQEDWHLLPDVPAGRDSVNLHEAAEARSQELIRRLNLAGGAH